MKETIKMQHDRSTVKRLATAQYRTFSGVSRFIWYGISAVMILLGFGLLYDFGTPYRYLFLAAGGILLGNTGVSAQMKADKTLRAIEQQGGHFPCTLMTFRDSDILVQEKEGKSRTITYQSFQRLSEDSAYYYLFITNEAAYMVPKDQIRNPSEFRSRLQSASGRRIEQTGGILSVRLRDLLKK